MSEAGSYQGEIILYTAPDGAGKVDVLLSGDTFWLTQRRIAELFGVDVRTIGEHLGNIFESNELESAATIRKFRIVQWKSPGKWPESSTTTP